MKKSNKKTNTKKTNAKKSATKKTASKKPATKKPTKKTAPKKSTPKKPKTTKPEKKTYIEQEKIILVPVVVKKHYDNNGGHPHVILETIENKHVSVGLTTKVKKGKNSTNKELKVNPLGGEETSYIRRQATIDRVGKYKNPTDGLMESNDFAKAKEYGEKAKKKIIKK